MVVVIESHLFIYLTPYTNRNDSSTKATK